MSFVLKHALRAELPTIAEIWTDAFSADPYFRWIQPDDARWPAFGVEWMTFIAELCLERGHTYLDDARRFAVALIPPDVAFVDADGVQRGRSIIARHAGEDGADQALAAIMAARAEGLETSHWTLQYIGVVSGAQGHGLGREAVGPLLDTCDREGLPCGLVSTNTRNVSFYESVGFRVTAEIPVADGVAVMRPMVRD